MLSMTGYGRRQVSCDGREITVEVKSVNHRFLDIAFRAPRSLSFLEEPFKKALSNQLARGHADVFLSYRNSREDAREAIIDKQLMNAYKAALNEAAEEMKMDNDLSFRDYVHLDNVMTVIEKEEDREAVTALALNALDLALLDLVQMRKTEGQALLHDLSRYLDELKTLKADIAAIAPEVPKNYREKMSQRLMEAEIEQIDPQRLAQEVAIFADKCAVDEELSRLDSHFEQMAAMLLQEGEAGRKLDFLVQELNREVNTIGSKAADSRVTNDVIKAKAAIEKMREQVQNVE